MADPLSIAASIAGLISLADTVFRLVFKYARSAINAKQEVKLLADEIQALAGVLQNLRLLASGLEAEGHSFDPTIQVHHLGLLGSTLNRLHQRAEKAHEKFEHGSKTQQRLQQLKWPFSTDDTKELLKDLVRHKTTISLALSADSLRKLQVCLTKQEEQRQTLSSIENTVKRIEIHTQIVLNDNKKKVLDFFMKISPQPNLEISVKLRELMTGLWLTGSPSFTTWMETAGSKLWLSGIPGAGKTVLAGAVIQDAIERCDSNPEVGVAFFFCDYKNPTTWNIVNILGAIASQLSRQKDDAYNSLQKYYDQLHPAGRLEKSPDREELRDKITEMSKHFGQIIIIVDGLDECGESSDVVAETLSELAKYTSNMSMALFSRHEVNIQEWLRDDFEHIEIAAKSNDVRLYVAAEMEKRIQNRRLRISNMDLKDEIMNKLVDGAKGMFRWVACQLDYLCDCLTDADRRKALNELPPDLPETYRRLLERVNKSSPKVKSLVQMCLQFIAFASPRLTIPQLQQAVSVPETPGALLGSSDLVSADEIARRCSSLIRKSEDGEAFEFSHFSVQEFLTDASLLKSSALEMYHLSESRSYMLLAMQCLRFLQLKNFARHPESWEQEIEHIFVKNRETPFYEYAAVLWPKFARSHLGDPVLFKLSNSLFQRPKTAQFIAWSVEFLHDVFRKQWKLSKEVHLTRVEFCVRGITDDCFSPLHLAAALALPQICQSLLENESDLNHNSAWGSPLELATASVTGFCEIENGLWHIDREWCDDLALHSDTALKDKMATMELLVRAGAAVTASRSQQGFNLLDLSFVFAAASHDISASTKLMSLGVKLGQKNPESFKMCTSWWIAKRPDQSPWIDRMKESLRDFLRHLIFTPSNTTDIRDEIVSSAWATASHLSINLASDFGLMGANPAGRREFLRAKVLTAVLHDDAETLRNFLINEDCDISGRFHPFPGNPDYGCSLLHVAARHNSASASQILLDFGCDLNALDSNGEPPIHLCASRRHFGTLEVFLQKGASHLAADSSGGSIWHKSCKRFDGVSIIKRLLDLDQDQTTEALLARTSSGETPLVLALQNSRSSNNVAKVLAIIEHCAQKAQFWRAHGPVFAAAANFGSATVIEHLLQAGAELDPVGNDNLTPLHELGEAATPACAQILGRLYPDAHTLRFQGLIPLERYIEKRMKSLQMVDQELLALLATPKALSSPNMDGGTVWSFCCKEIPIRALQSDDPDRIWYRFDDLISSLLRLGALTSYEEAKRESGILPLFSVLGLESKQIQIRTTQISRESLSAIILASRYWNDAKRSPAAISFLKKAIQDGNVEAVRIVLEQGVSVHQRVDQTSPMERAVSNFSNVHWSVPSDESIASDEPIASAEATSKEIIIALLSHAAAAEMKAGSPHGAGLGLLHMIAEAHPTGKTHTRWLVEELVGRGVNINGEARFQPGCTPLVHHLSRDAFQTAEILLDLGANPFANADFDPVHASLAADGLSFLRRLLRCSKETGISVQWNGIKTDIIGIQGISNKPESISPIHVIAGKGLSEILDFYVDEGLLKDINVKTANGHTAVHLAALADQAALINQLHLQGASLDIQSDDGSTALHLAVRYDCPSAAKTLLELGLKSSLDAVAMTPRMYALARKDDNMIKLLDRYLPLDATPSTFVDAHPLSWKRKQYLAQSFEDALERDDLEECQRLHHAGFPLDTTFSSGLGCSPMVEALRKGRLRIVDWLLNCEETTLETAFDRYSGATAIEFAMAQARFNPILKRLLSLCMEQGGDLIRNDHSPLKWAIINHNEEGLRIFLDFVKEMTERGRRLPSSSSSSSSSASASASASEVTAHLVKQRIYSHKGDWFCTPLHIAAEYGNISAIEILLDSGANVDECDSNYLSPLECILHMTFADQFTKKYEENFDKNEAIDAVVRLVQLGAATGIVMSCPALRLLDNFIGATELSDLLFQQTPAAGHNQAPSMLDRATIESDDWECVFRDNSIQLQNLEPEFEDDFGGKSLMHEAICWRGYSALPLRWDGALQTMTPFPWHYYWHKLDKMIFLTTSFKLYRRRLSHDAFKRIMNLQPARGMSPLCRASSRGILEVMENCLAMGAEIDFEGCSLGSAMMIACACGRLDAVKLLVRRGAAISYVGKRGLTSAVMAGHRSKAVIAWLLVGQFTEQKRLNCSDQPSSSSNAQDEFRPWSGIANVDFRLVGRYRMQRHESSLEYAARLSNLKRELRGSIISGGDSFATP